MPATMPRSSGRPWSTTSTAITAAAKPETEPIDRSISPSSRTSTMPSESMPSGAANSVMLTTEKLERKRGSMA